VGLWLTFGLGRLEASRTKTKRPRDSPGRGVKTILSLHELLGSRGVTYNTTEQRKVNRSVAGTVISVRIQAFKPDKRLITSLAAGTKKKEREKSKRKKKQSKPRGITMNLS